MKIFPKEATFICTTFYHGTCTHEWSCPTCKEKLSYKVYRCPNCSQRLSFSSPYANTPFDYKHF